MNSEENKPPKFNILKDEPLTENEMDRFEYSDIAEELANIIQNVKTPFTIGLYGKWGCGKTSICKLIEKNLKKDDKFKTFYFDVWKYENDSFRRQFLIELDEKLFEGKSKYREKLNQSLTIPKTLSLKENIRIIWDDILLKVFIIFSVLTIALIFIKNIIIPYIASVELMNLFKRIIDLGLIFNIFNFILNSVKLYQGSIQINKVDSAEGFEHYYEEQLKKLVDKKLLIIIDNLDRLTSEKVVSVLSDIKTFLAKSDDDNNTVFIIPCDNESLSHHLCNIYDENFDVDEFLRKFFNLTFKIPKLLDIELDDYTSMKLKETGILEFQNDYSLSFVITQAFRDNPREIIQFINSLVGSFLLARGRGLSDVLDNLAFLAKILVIRQKWPVSYAKIENEILRTGIDLDSAVRKTSNNEEGNKIKDFLNITPAKTNNYDIFFSLHKSKQEKEFLELDSFLLSAIEKRFSDVELIYKKIKGNGNIVEFNRILNDYINKNKNKKEQILNIFVSIVKILSIDRAERLSDFKDFLSYGFTILNDPNIYIKWINDINFANLLNDDAVKFIQKEFYDIFIENICNALRSETEKGQPTIDIYKGMELFHLLGTDSIWGNINNPNDILSQAKSKFIHSINIEEVVVNKKQLDSVINFILSERPISMWSIPPSISKINEIITHNAIGENIWKILDNTRLFLDKIERSYSFDSSNISIQDISNTIIAKYNQVQNWSEKSNLIKFIFSLKKIKGNPLRDQLNSLVVNFISNTDNPCENIYTNIPKKTMIKMIETEMMYKNAIINRSKTLPDIFIKYDLANSFNEQERDSIIRALMSNQRELLTLLEYLNFNLPEVSIEWLVKAMVDIINMVPLEFFAKWINAIKELKIDNYPALIESFRLNLQQVKQKGDGFNDVITNFASRNRKLFEGIIDELTK